MKIIFRYLFALILSLTLSLQAQEINFKQSKSSAGKASLTSEGFYTDFVLDTANFSPELRMPIQAFYDSSSKEQGLLGFAWNIPQLESTVIPDKNGALWTTPWGEKIAFYSRKNTDKDTLAMFNEIERENAYFSPFADWTANGREDSGSWTIFGRKELKGWKFTYVNGRLTEITAHTGESLQFVYEGKTLKEVKQKGEAFISLKYGDKVLSEISINGIAHKLTFAEGKAQILPETPAGKEAIIDVKFLSAVNRAQLNPIAFKYDGDGFLTQIKRGEFEDNIAVERETIAQRKDYFRKLADAKKAGKSTTSIKRHKYAGRILSDSNFKYTYPSGKLGDVKIENKLKQVASYNYDSRTGVFKHTDFAGKATEIYYFMRYDVAYNGNVRQIVDAQKRVVANYRYDKDSGKITRFRDLAKNDVNLKYDSKGNLIEIAKRGADEASSTPIKSFSYERDSLKPKAINILNERGEVAQTTSIQYNREQRPTLVDDGRNAIKVMYSAYGYPTVIADSIGNETKLFYDRYNRIIARENPNGTKSFTEYNAFGQVAKSFTKFGDEILSSVEIAYDLNGAPLSFKDQSGFVKKYERDALGRVEKEIFPDNTEVAYDYNPIGKLEKVIDQSGNEINFAWGKFGLDSRTTAVGQITKNEYDKFGKLLSIESKFEGKNADRVIKYSYDGLDKISQISYGKDQVEKLKYDSWGRLREQIKGGLKSTFKYDHFGRLAETSEGVSNTKYTYNNYGQRLSRITKIGPETLDEYNTYDKLGRLVKRESGGKVVEYKYNVKNQVVEQIIDGKRVVFEYTKLGQLAKKAMLDGEGKVITELCYFYSKDGKIISRLANGKLQEYKYDAKMQLLAVIDAESKIAVEEYVYDKSGNILKKTVNGKITEYTFDATNQLVSSLENGKTTHYVYDAAGRLIKEGDKVYTYGWLDKVLNVAENDKTLAQFEYHNNGQIAKALRASGEVETFTWDALALIERNGIKYINEPHVGGGNPILAINKTADNEMLENSSIFFNDALGSTLGNLSEKGYSAFSKTSFGNSTADADSSNSDAFFTGKPYVEDLGYTFLFRNYRSDQSKWQVSDLIGYPDGWNNLTYCSNSVISCIDWLGALDINLFNSTSDSFLHNSANNITTGGVSVAGHGNANGIADANGNMLSPQQLATMIQSAPGYNSQPVWLYGCNLGSGTYAQELANILGNTVFAPTDYLWFDANGKTTVAGMNPDGTMGKVKPAGWKASVKE